ncbi:aspartate-semialdehyde dehydrogenase, partial [bacterium]|nr:aspartate-semialdehyde dehydrogenase [bacterium]
MSNKIKTGISGATGIVGQRLISMLWEHPNFEIIALSASKTSAGKKYCDAVSWKLAHDIPPNIRELIVKDELTKDDCDIVLSSLPSESAGPYEDQLRKAGVKVITNSSPHRMDEDVPLVIPEINPDHIEIVREQNGFIIANPNCSAVNLTLAIAPLHYSFGVTDVIVSTYQAISGAGYPGVSAMDIIDNVIPYIGDEEPKLEAEPRKILGKLAGNKVIDAPINISSQCIRVNVTDGHFMTVSVKLAQKTKKDDIINAINSFNRLPTRLNLPSLPPKPLIYLDSDTRPQPRLDRDLGGGMVVSVGRLRKCPILDYKFVVLGHN